MAHFRRLVAESGHLIDWHFVFNDDVKAQPEADLAYTPASVLMPRRHAEMIASGAVQHGFMDVFILPIVRALSVDFVWAMEYDVDFTGDWQRFFEQFSRNDADLLTTTVASRADTPKWTFWPSSGAPKSVGEHHYHRAFHPMMRVSRRFSAHYLDAIADPGWQGHYEFILPTMALAGGFRMEDIGGGGLFTPTSRRGRLYDNDPRNLSEPGTFVWRPSRPRYYHEAPQDFPRRDTLYHPIKASIGDWNHKRRDGGSGWKSLIKRLRSRRRRSA